MSKTTITEVNKRDQDKLRIQTEEIFKWNPKPDAFLYSGHSNLLNEQTEKIGASLEEIELELKRRKIILEWMVQKGIRHYMQVANTIREYYVDPKRVYRRARVGLK